jgi:hypothetical protein
MQNHAILRNALRKRNYELPSVSTDMQSSEVLRNSLGLNYKSAALSGGTGGCKINKRAKLTLLFGRRRDTQICPFGQKRVRQLVTLWSVCNESQTIFECLLFGHWLNCGVCDLSPVK